MFDFKMFLICISGLLYLKNLIKLYLNKFILSRTIKRYLRDTFSKNHIFWEIGKKKFSIFKFFFNFRIPHSLISL